MAEGKRDMDKSIEELEKEITCTICHEHYTDPKVLPCCHYYCKQCIHLLAERTGLDKPFSCPECRADTTLPHGGVDSLQSAFFINRMKAMHSKLELAHGKVEAKCELCSEDVAEAFCRQCAKFICPDCAKSHLKMKNVFPGHKVSTLEELRKGDVKEIAVQESTLQMCQLHDEPKKVFCFDCSALICRDCSIKDHRDHKYEFLKIAAQEMKETLTLQLCHLRQRKKVLSQAVEGIRATKIEIEAQGELVTKKIESSFKHVKKILEDRKNGLLVEAGEKVAQKLLHLSNQEKTLSTSCAMIQSVLDYTEQCVEHSTDDDIMTAHAEIQSRINKEVERLLKKKAKFEPMEEADMRAEVISPKSLEELCQSDAKLVKLPFAAGHGINSAEVAKTSEFSVFTKCLYGVPPIVNCSLKTLETGSESKCAVNYIGNGEYHIKYSPTVRGRHKLAVTVGGKHVAGSPFPVFVSIPPTELGKPVKVIDTGSVCGVTVPSAWQMNVVGSVGYMIMGKAGERIKVMNERELGIKGIRGVCVENGTGCVYIAGQEAFGLRGIIVKLSREYKLLCETTMDQERWFWGIALVQEEVWACDKTNSRIMIFSKQLQYLRQISGPDKQPLSPYFSLDKHNNLYLGDQEARCILVLSQAGKFICAFGRDIKGVKILGEPRGVCVSGGHVYVTDSLHQVSVFTTAGDHVITFGQEGKKEGEFDEPWEVFVDKDGYVYVCDHCNKRVQVF